MKPQTILIVEDSPSMRRTLRELLADLMTACYECSDGQGALTAYRQFNPDWVLMDLKMVEMDGLTATAAICANYPAARILIVTNYDDPALREAARHAGACGFCSEREFAGVARAYKINTLLDTLNVVPHTIHLRRHCCRA